MEERSDQTAEVGAAARGALPREEVIIGDFTLDLATGELSGKDGVAVLQPSSLAVLKVLINRLGEVVSSDELIQTVWPNRIIGDDAIHRRIADLRKHFGDDARQPHYVETLPRRGYRLIASVSPTSLTPRRRPPTRRAAAAATAVSLILAFGAYLYLDRQQDLEHQARLERIAALVQNGDAFGTFLELRKIERQDPMLRVLTAGVMETGRIETDPDGASISVRWRPGDPWHRVGSTPLEMAFPVGVYSIRLDKPGYTSRTILEANPGLAFNNIDEPTYRLKLLSDNKTDESTVLVQGGEFPTPFIMTRDRFDIDDFLIDRFEVTNADFKAFIDAGGYHEPNWWTDYPGARTDPPHLRFTDSTGDTGPASWEFGSYPTGAEFLPVTGVSWYEAQAYARWSGRHLPTALDWARAALSPVEWQHPIASVAIESANITSGHLLPVGESGSLTASGAADLIGNAREWTSSTTHDLGIVIGGSFDSPRVQYAFPLPTERLNRSPLNGFRLVTYLGERNARLTSALEWEMSGDVVYEPVSDETFAGIRALYTYEPGAVSADDARLVRQTDEGDWTRRVIELPTINPEDPLPVQLFIPKDASPPYQPVLFVPPSDSFGPTLASSDVDIADYFLDVIVRDGRALIWPVWAGTHERFHGKWSQEHDTFLARAAQAHRLRRNEVGRVIDYLNDSPEFDGSRVGLIARGWGATYTVHSMLALEHRIRAVVLWNPLYPHGGPELQNPVINPATYWPRVTQPVFAATGSELAFANRKADPRLLIQMIGTASEHKALKVYDGPHWPLPRRELLSDSIAWLNRYLGRPDGSSESMPGSDHDLGSSMNKPST
jgi:DNA-binding winged helix-turn-helix (wHTH) protein/dienelactone hydrolase